MAKDLTQSIGQASDRISKMLNKQTSGYEVGDLTSALISGKPIAGIAQQRRALDVQNQNAFLSSLMSQKGLQMQEGRFKMAQEEFEYKKADREAKLRGGAWKGMMTVLNKMPPPEAQKYLPIIMKSDRINETTPAWEAEKIAAEIILENGGSPGTDMTKYETEQILKQRHARPTKISAFEEKIRALVKHFEMEREDAVKFLMTKRFYNQDTGEFKQVVPGETDGTRPRHVPVVSDAVGGVPGGGPGVGPAVGEVPVVDSDFKIVNGKKVHKSAKVRQQIFAEERKTTKEKLEKQKKGTRMLSKLAKAREAVEKAVGPLPVIQEFLTRMPDLSGIPLLGDAWKRIPAEIRSNPEVVKARAKLRIFREELIEAMKKSARASVPEQKRILDLFDNLGFLSTDIAAKGDLAALREAIEDMFEIGEASEKAPTGSNTEETKEKLKNKYRIPLE
jgi:hypothetical protein